MRYDAVMFDLDGTLLDTLEDLADSMNEVLAGLGAPAHGVDAYRVFVGDGVVNLVRRALPEGRRDEETVGRAAARMREVYGGRYAVKTRPYEGVPELLGALAGRGVRLSVLSNKPDGMTGAVVDRFLGGERFEVVRGATDDVPRKPDPAGALLIAEAMAVPPERFLYLGDTNTDMRTAVSAGMHPVGALWGFRTEDELVAAGAAALVAHPAEVLALLENG